MTKKCERYCHDSRADCFAYNLAKCDALETTDFKGKCPFYQTEDKRLSNHFGNIVRLIKSGRRDLIEKYHLAPWNGSAKE